VSHGRRLLQTSFARAGFFLLAALFLLHPRGAGAVPYASALTNAGGRLSFRLNEAADRVRVVGGDGAGTNDLGALPAGLHVFTTDVEGVFQIEVFKAGGAGFLTPVGANRGAVLQISPDTKATRFFSPRGVAINKDPASPHFGRIYVANATSGVISNGFSGSPRAVGDGIYALNSDFTDALGQEDVPLTGGLNFAAGQDLSPYRLTVGQDGNLYVCDYSDTNGGLYVVSADVGPGSGTNVLGGPAGSLFPVGNSRVHGSIAAAVVEGSVAASNLTAYVIDEDLQTDRAEPVRWMVNSLWRHELREMLPGPDYQTPQIIAAAPWVGFVSQIMDLSRGANGYFYVNDYRSPGNDWAGLYVLNANGAPLWNSLAATRALLNDPSAVDYLRATGGADVSPRGDLTALINLETNGITVVPLMNGLPDLANRLVFQGFPETAGGQGRDVAFDAAGNLYAISSGARALRAFSPGGKTTAITGSDGTFQLIRDPEVRVTATAAVAMESSANGVFSITRTGDTSGALAVAYALSGSAQPGTDYSITGGTATAATIPPGTGSVDIVITAIDDGLSEAVKSVTLTLLASGDYNLTAPAAATVAIADDDIAVITVSAADVRAYERHPSDHLVFLFERIGQTNTELLVSFGLGGTADPAGDYTGAQGGGLPALITIPAGQSSQTLIVEPFDDVLLESNETVRITIFPGSDSYLIGTPGSAAGVIIDDELPPTAQAFFEDFESDTSANWITRFGANNGIYDAEVRWAFDYSTLGIPPAPNSAPGTTRGVFVQINKTNSAPGGSAAINLYPVGRRFSGNHALRFDMLLNYGLVSTTEHALAGINHSGLLTNRVTQSADTNDTTRGGDGLFAAIGADGTDNRSWAAYAFPDPSGLPALLTNRDPLSVSTLIPSPPYSSTGSPGVGPQDDKTWAEVELGQANGVVTLKVNNSVIWSLANTSSFADGNVMIGLNDQFNSIGSGGTNGNFVLFDNVRVVTPGVFITSVQLTESEVQLDFAAPGGQPGDFKIQAATNPSPTGWADENSAVISATPQGFRAKAPRGSARFYRVRR